MVATTTMMLKLLRRYQTVGLELQCLNAYLKESSLFWPNPKLPGPVGSMAATSVSQGKTCLPQWDPSSNHWLFHLAVAPMLSYPAQGGGKDLAVEATARLHLPCGPVPPLSGSPPHPQTSVVLAASLIGIEAECKLAPAQRRHALLFGCHYCALQHVCDSFSWLFTCTSDERAVRIEPLEIY